MNTRPRHCVFILAGLLITLGLQAQVEQVQPLAAGAEFKLTDGRLQVEFITDRIARVRATKNADWSKTPSLMRAPVAEKPGQVTIKDWDDIIELSSAKLMVRIDRATEAVSYFNADGQPFLTENPSEPRKLEKVDVVKSVADPATITKVKTVDGEREVAGKHIQSKDREAWKGKISFRFADGEALYGLGEDETDDLNLRGTTKRLYVHNLRKMIPSLVSTRGYGLLFDAYSAVAFTDGKDGGSLAFDVIDDLDYYFIAGPDMDGAVAGYHQLTGAAVMLPRWAYGYVQSPLFVKAGSILPLGPRVQYANEQPGAPIELRIYPGADGVFTLYEDEGDNYNYEKGKYTTIPISWDEAKNTLTIGKRSGNFPGMLKERTFHVVLVRLGFGVGIAPEPNPDAISHYVGKTMTLSLGKK